MKFFIFMIAFTSTAHAAPYIEYKNKYDLRVQQSKDNYVRIGYKTSKLYGEVGKDSAEVGYKIKASNFTFKGKVESTEDFKKTTLETEVRVTF
jgi:hypothetical protein